MSFFASSLSDTKHTSSHQALLASLDLETQLYAKRIVSLGSTISNLSLKRADLLLRAIKAKAYGNKIMYLLPLLGNGILAATVPLRDALNVGPANNINFVDADFNEQDGLQGDGSTKAFDTLIKSSQIARGWAGGSASGGLGYFENNYKPNDTNSDVIGSVGWTVSSFTSIFVIQLFTTRPKFCWGSGSNVTPDVTPRGNGHYYGQRPIRTLRKLYFNGVSIASNTTADDGSAALNDPPMAVLGVTTGLGQPPSLVCSGGRCALAYFTDGSLADADVTDFDTLIRSFLIQPLGREKVPPVSSTMKMRLAAGRRAAVSYPYPPFRR